MTTPFAKIQHLPAGRELDALIAEQLFDWDWYTVVNINLLLPPDHSYREHPVLATPGKTPGYETDLDSLRFYDSTRGGPTMPSVPHFSTDNALAFAVQTEMHRRGYWMQLRSPFGDASDWSCGFTPHKTTGWNGRPDYSAQADTPALAVCRAALLVVNDQQGG
jgi:hypothetical protein